jgi:hypothetical protein
LVVGNEFYVYFREYTGAIVKYCVAKANIDDVITEAVAGNVSEWEKWNGGTNWTDAIRGAGVDVLTERPDAWLNVNIHGDAIHLSSSNNSPYIMVTSAIKNDPVAGLLDISAILMFKSDDGLHWGPPRVVVEKAGADCLTYPFIMAMQGASDDGHETSENSFYVYYQENTLPPPGGITGSNFATMRQRAIINITPIMNLLLLD